MQKHLAIRGIGILLILCLITGCAISLRSQPTSHAFAPPVASESAASAATPSSLAEAVKAPALNPADYLAPTLPVLTEEELARVDELVSPEIWDSLSLCEISTSPAIAQAASIEISGRYTSYDCKINKVISACLGKQLEQITYGELWRFRHINGRLDTCIFYAKSYDEFPIGLKEFKSITQISFKLIGVFPYSPSFDMSSLTEMVWLEELALIGRNQHEYFEFPIEIAKLSNLKILDLSFGCITELPDIFDAFPKLESLNLTWNYFDTLPPSLFRLQNLKVLDISKTDYFMIQPEIGALKSLEELYLGPVYFLPETIGNLHTLRVLDIKSSSIREKGQTYGDPQKYITELPNSICNLSNLKELWILNCPLTAMPTDFQNLTSLEYLDLQGDRISALPPGFENLKKLQFVNFQSDELTQQARQLLGLK